MYLYQSVNLKYIQKKEQRLYLFFNIITNLELKEFNIKNIKFWQ